MGRREIFITVGVILFIVVFVVLFILSRVTPTTSTNRNRNTGGSAPKTTPIVNRGLVSVNNIVSDPLVYDGLQVEIDSKVADWITKRSFTVGSTGGLFSGGGKKLLVVADTNFKLPKETKGSELGLGERVNVHLKGRVRIMDKEELSQLMGIDLDGTDIKLDDGNTETWREGSVLILESVNKL